MSPAVDAAAPAVKRERLSTATAKLVCLITSSLFVLTTVINLIITIYALQLRLTRVSQINFGYQIVFLMPFIPFVFGILFENRELLVPFFIVNVYSTLFNVLLTVLLNIHLVDFEPLDPKPITALCICSAVVSTICGFFQVILWQKFTTIYEQRQNKDDTEFKINSYSLQRFGDIVK